MEGKIPLSGYQKTLAMILIIDDFITGKECKQLIKIYNQNEGLARSWPPKATGPRAHPLDIQHVFTPFVKRILSRTEEVVKQYFNPKISIDRVELKKHDKGAMHPFHFDTAKSATVLFSIIYLNTLSSGYTVFKDGTQVAPIIGRLLLFNGQKYFHGVNQTQEKRYTLSTWYRLSS